MGDDVSKHAKLPGRFVIAFLFSNESHSFYLNAALKSLLLLVDLFARSVSILLIRQLQSLEGHREGAIYGYCLRQ